MKIARLDIKTKDLWKQHEFYSKTLGLKTYKSSGNSFEVQTGSSILKLTEDPSFTPYHIAFHIPSAIEKEALQWVKQRVEILKNDKKEIVDFSAWNAMSLYFYDADKNIMEFISRKDLYLPDTKIFSEYSILAIAEIGLATADIPDKFQILNRKCGLEKFDGNFENFCAVGDDEGLIITIDKDKKNWFPTNDEAFVSDFELIFSHENKRFKIIFEQDRLTVV